MPSETSDPLRDAYLGALRPAAEALGLEISAPVADGLWRHHQRLVAWAKKINLSTVLDPRDAAIRHGLDSLLFQAGWPDGEPGRVLDVGSGGGFPGIPVALVRPAWRVVLLEPLHKRTAFLRLVAAELGLDNVQVVDGRLEPAPAPWPSRLGPPFEVVVSRATLPWAQLLPAASRALAPGGLLVSSHGRRAPDPAEIDAAAIRSGFVHEARREITLPGSIRRVIDHFRRAGERSR